MRIERGFSHSEPQRRPHNELENLYRSWGVFDLLHETVDRLPPDWLIVLNIARNLLDGKPIPGINVPDALRALTERNVRIDYEKRLVTRKWQESTEIPTADIDVRPIERLIELPKVLPPYLLLADVEPDLFAYNALTGNLPVAENQKPKIIMEEKSEEVEELEEVRKVGRSMRQKVFVLFDRSRSMDDNNKLIFSKAVVMSYLAKAYEENAQIYFRAFISDADDRIECIHPEEFASLSGEVLSVHFTHKLMVRILQQMIPTPPDYKPLGTNIGGAISTALEDVKEIDQLKEDQDATTEILLITDGASYTPIPRIPPNITLHTLHLQGGKEVEYDPWMTRRQYEASVGDLEDRSKTYTLIDTSRLKAPPFETDAKLLEEEADRLASESSLNDSPETQNENETQKSIKKAREMTTAYRKMYPKDRGLKKTGKKIERAGNGTEPGGIQELIQQTIETIKQKIKRRASSKENKKAQQNKEKRKIGPIRTPSVNASSATLFDFRIKRDQ